MDAKTIEVLQRMDAGLKLATEEELEMQGVKDARHLCETLVKTDNQALHLTTVLAMWRELWERGRIQMGLQTPNWNEAKMRDLVNTTDLVLGKAPPPAPAAEPMGLAGN